MPNVEVSYLCTDRKQLRSELEDLLLGYDSVIFASIGFREGSEQLLVSVGTNDARLCAAEAALFVSELSRRELDFEVQILTGRTAD